MIVTNDVLDEYRSSCSSVAMNLQPSVSRRARPAKAPLSREAIVAAALAILEQDGIGGLSLRRVAAALDTGPASLYVYFANLGDLHAEMLDTALREVELPHSSRASWRKRLKALLISYMLVLYNRPGLAKLALSQIVCGPTSLRIAETILALLMEGGVGEKGAALAVDLLTLYATAIAAEQSLRRDKERDFNRAKKALAELSATEFPLLSSAVDHLLSGTGEARFLWAIDVMLDGVLSAPLPDR